MPYRVRVILNPIDEQPSKETVCLIHEENQIQAAAAALHSFAHEHGLRAITGKPEAGFAIEVTHVKERNQ